MSINLGGNAISHSAAQQAAVIAEQVADQLESAQDSTVSEGVQEGDASSTVTKDAVQGKNSDSQGQGDGGKHPSEQNSSEIKDAKTAKSNTASTAQRSSTTSGTEINLEKTASTQTDVDGVLSAPISKTQKEGEPIFVDFAQPTLPAPTRFTSAELVIAMIKLGADSVDQSLKAQQGSIESTQIARLQDLQIKAQMMQDYYKNSPPTKSGFKMIFEGIAALFKGNLQEAGELLKRGFEASGAQIASIVMTVISIALAVASFGGASALVVLSCAALVTSFLSDPALMKDIVDLCTDGGSSDLKGFLDEFTKAMQGITMALQVITMVMSLGTSAGALVSKVVTKIAAKTAKVATKAASKTSSFAAKNTLDLAQKMSKNMSKFVSKNLGDSKKVDKTMSTFAKVSTTSAEVVSTTAGVTSSVMTAVTTAKTAEHQAFQAEVDRFDIYLDSHKIDGEKQDALTEQIMDRYRAMLETLMQSVASLNSAMVSAAKA
ncbi:MAG: hypothetical protein ACRCV3_00645 [Desulfovibrionaceae bacterium]